MELISERNYINLDEDEAEEMISKEIAEIQVNNTLYYYTSGLNFN